MKINQEMIALAKDAVLNDEKAIRPKSVCALYLALAEKAQPGTCTEELLHVLRFAISAGHEPAFDLTPNFYFPMLAGTVALCHEVPSLWSKLTSYEVERLDMLMRCMAYMTAIGTDDETEYRSGPSGNGNYCKNWNPNYPLSNVPQILMCIPFFGSPEAVNKVLADFDYDDCVAKFHRWGWKNTLSIWERETNPETGAIRYVTCSEGELKEVREGQIVEDDGKGHLKLKIITSSEDVRAREYGKLEQSFVDGEERIIDYTTPKAVLTDGGPVYATKALYRISQYVGCPRGTGIGIPAIGRKGYCYKGNTLDNPAGAWNFLLDYNYSGGIVASEEIPDENGVPRCYVYDRVPSPVEGLEGMMREFRSGKRSSVGYCSVDFLLCACTTVALEALGLYDFQDPVNLPLAKKEWVGNVDYLHKSEHGYVSFSGTEVRGAPHPQFGDHNDPAYMIWKTCWEENGKPKFSLADFK